MFVLCLVSRVVEIVSHLHYNVYSNIQQTGGTATFQPHFTNKSKWSVFPWSYFLFDDFKNRLSAPARCKFVCSFSLPVGNHFLFLELDPLFVSRPWSITTTKKDSTDVRSRKKMTFQNRTRCNCCCRARTIVTNGLFTRARRLKLRVRLRN